mgnify:CR=1 FL=1
MGQYTMYIIIGIVVVILYIVWMVYANKKHRGYVNKWLKEHPDAVKVYVSNPNGVIKQAQITIGAVDNETVMTFNAGMAYGFYLTPGTHVIDATCTTQRPGVMYRNVYTTYGPVKVEVSVKANQEYTFSFDKKKEEFFLKEKK